MFSVSSVSEIKKDIENMGFLKVTVIFFKRDQKGRYKWLNIKEKRGLHHMKKLLIIYHKLNI